MYRTVDDIHRSMLGNVPDEHEKMEGSLIYDATKPVAIELEQAYKDLEQTNKNTSLDDATEDALTELCYQNGTFRKEGETDEQLRERHRQKVNTPPQDGNIAQYLEWADKFGGIGVSKLFPFWNGGNTVKVAITNMSYQVAEQTLVDAFQNYLDPNSEGLGNGAAPLGVKVTVTGGVRKDINITANVVLAEGYTEPEGVAEAINKYFSSITYIKNSVSYMRMAVDILDTPSIVDMNSFTLNGGTVDVALVGEEIPTLNSINLTVVTG